MMRPRAVDPDRATDWRLAAVVAAMLVVVTYGVYSRVGTFGFTNFDDPDYVAQNAIVQRGLSVEGLKWAFTTGFMGNWHPLTWLSHMLDCELFGLNPGAHHVSNLAIHCLNTVLLFWVLSRYTRAMERSAFVAGLFALHPFHVESVAWIAERKDVISTLFWIMTMGAYLRYVERHSIRRYLGVLVCFALGLMSKPMLVTLPLVLLVLDYWPLQRMRAIGEWRPVLIEKVPLFALAIASSVITFIVQREGGAVGSIERFSITTRIANALVAYTTYIGKTVMPEDLAVFYPHPGAWPVWQAAGAFVLLALITSVSLALVRRAPYVLAGWLWFVGTMVPVIGLVQVGEQAYADRYTYVPLIGIFIAVVWGIADLALKLQWPVIAVRGVGIAGLLACGMLTMSQVNHWRDSETLFRHALGATRDNHIAHYSLAQSLSVSGRIYEAVEHYYATLELKPDHEGAHNNLGLTHAIQGKWTIATNHYAQALRANPGNADVHFNMAIALSRLGDATNALVHLRRVLQLNPGHAFARKELAELLAPVGQELP
jgi:hypothetical protein